MSCRRCDFAAYCLKKGIRLCSSRPTRPPIDACGCLPFSGVFRHREAASFMFLFRTSSLLARALLALRSWTAFCGVREAGGKACQHGPPSAWMAREGAPALSGEGPARLVRSRSGRHFLGLAASVWAPKCLQPASMVPFSGSLCSACSFLAGAHILRTAFGL